MKSLETEYTQVSGRNDDDSLIVPPYTRNSLYSYDHLRAAASPVNSLSLLGDICYIGNQSTLAKPNDLSFQSLSNNDNQVGLVSSEKTPISNLGFNPAGLITVNSIPEDRALSTNEMLYGVAKESEIGFYSTNKELIPNYGCNVVAGHNTAQVLSAGMLEEDYSKVGSFAKSNNTYENLGTNIHNIDYTKPPTISGTRIRGANLNANGIFDSSGSAYASNDDCVYTTDKLSLSPLFTSPINDRGGLISIGENSLSSPWWNKITAEGSIKSDRDTGITLSLHPKTYDYPTLEPYVSQAEKQNAELKKDNLKLKRKFEYIKQQNDEIKQQSNDIKKQSAEIVNMLQSFIEQQNHKFLPPIEETNSGYIITGKQEKAKNIYSAVSAFIKDHHTNTKKVLSKKEAITLMIKYRDKHGGTGLTAFQQSALGKARFSTINNRYSAGKNIWKRLEG
jgi:hypothetical protein